MKRRLTKLTAAGLAVLALTGCTGGVPEEVSEEPPVPKNVETTWTLVVGQPEGSTCWDAAESFAEALSDATEGAVAVEVQPRPLDRVTSLEQAAAGIVDLYLDSSFVYGSYGDEEELGRPFFSVTMPFLFPDAETAAEVLDSTGGEALNGVLAELGLRGLAYGELGFRYPTTSEGRAVTAPEDLEGLKIRTAGMLEVSLAYVDCWGAELYPSSFLDVMTPLSAGYYDGQESTLAEADAAGYQTVQTDVTIFPAFYEPAILTMNSDLYDSLSPDLREAVDRCGREAMADQRLRNREQEAEILERWQEEDGISVHVLTEEQWGAFQALTDRLYDPEDPDKNIAEFKKEYRYYKDIADKKGIKLACYLGHGGNFVHSREILDKLLKEVPEFNIKLDPVGIMRNMKDDPYEIMKRYANRIAHFHAKDIFRYGDDGWEIEPIVGMGQLKWNVMLGMLWNVGYDGYIIIEPHGDVWAEPENRWKHIVLAKRHLEQYMIR